MNETTIIRDSMEENKSNTINITLLTLVKWDSKSIALLCQG